MKLLSTKPRALQFASAFAALCLTLLVFVEYSKRHWDDDLFGTRTLGEYQNDASGERAALKELSRQVAQNKSGIFWVYWQTQKNYKNCLLQYDSKSGELKMYSFGRARMTLTPHFPFYTFVNRDGFWGDDHLITWPRISRQEIHRAARNAETYSDICKPKLAENPL